MDNVDAQSKGDSKPAKQRKANLVDELLVGFRNNDADEIYFVRKPWTFVLAVFEIRGHLVQEYGFSKVCWPDGWDATTGKQIAVRHAAETLAKKIAAYPEGLDSQVGWIGYYPQGPMPDFSSLPLAPES